VSRTSRLSVVCLLCGGVFATPSAVSAHSICEPVLPLDSRGAPIDGEAVLRAETARAVACEWRRHPRDDEAIARYTEFYLTHANAPSCELMVIDARANIRLAQQQASVREGPSHRSSDRRWRRALDTLAAVSMAWSRAAASPSRDGVIERCVRPARDTLTAFPSVTVTVEPPDAVGYTLFWNGDVREHSLPGIIPGRQTLELNPPDGHTTSLSIDEVPVIHRHEGSVHRDLDLRWAQRMRITIRFEPVVPETERGPLVRGDSLGDRGGRRAPTLLWSGAAALALGLGGVTLSALRAASLEQRGNALYGERCPGSACPASEIRTYYSTSDDWRHWGYPISGVLAAGGLAGLVAYLLLDDGSEDRPTSKPMSGLWVGPDRVGATIDARF
jgi:hypothetical protein